MVLNKLDTTKTYIYHTYSASSITRRWRLLLHALKRVTVHKLNNLLNLGPIVIQVQKPSKVQIEFLPIGQLQLRDSCNRRFASIHVDDHIRRSVLLHPHKVHALGKDLLVILVVHGTTSAETGGEHLAYAVGADVTIDEGRVILSFGVDETCEVAVY